MALGNIECPNCGSTFEYDSEKAIATCPHCGGQFIVRNVKMDTYVNNYYNNSSKNNNNEIVETNDYRNMFDKLQVYAENNDANAINKVGTELYEKYPNSYAHIIYKSFVEYDRYFMFLSTKKFYETSNDYKEDIKSKRNYYTLMWKELKNDNYLLVKDEEFVKTISNDFNDKKTAEEIIYSISEGNYALEAQRYFNAFSCFVDFVNYIEGEVENGKILKYDFEKEHFKLLKRNKELANKINEELIKYYSEVNSFISKNKMSCNQYLDWLYKAKTNNIDYYTYGVDKSNSVTGIFCQVIGLILFVIGIILLTVNYSNDTASALMMVGSILLLAGYVVSFIGFLRFNDFQNSRKWAFILLPPVLMIMCIIYLIKNICYISRSKKSVKTANARINAVRRELDVYRKSAKYETISDMFDRFERDFDFSN